MVRQKPPCIQLIAMCQAQLCLPNVACTGSLGITQCLRSQRGQQQDVAAQQQEDIAAVAPLIFRVAGGSAGVPHLAALASHVSPHLLHVLASLQNSHVRDCQMVSYGTYWIFSKLHLATHRLLLAENLLIVFCSASSIALCYCASFCVPAAVLGHSAAPMSLTCCNISLQHSAV